MYFNLLCGFKRTEDACEIKYDRRFPVFEMELNHNQKLTHKIGGYDPPIKIEEVLMSRQLFTIFSLVLLVMLVVVGNIYSGNNAKIEKQEVSLVTPEVDAQWEARLEAFIRSGATLKQPHPIIPSTNNAAVATDTVGKTTYDFGANATLGRRFSLSPGTSNGIHFGYMGRTTGSNTDRYATYDFYDRDFGLFFGPEVFSSYAGSGWACAVDGQNHEALMVFHFTPTGSTVTTRFVKDDGQAFYSFSTDVLVDPAGLWPSLAANGNTLFVTNTADPSRIPGQSWYSTDFGATWTQSGFPTTPSPGAVQWESVENWPEFNPVNSSEIGFASIQEETPQNSGTTYQGGISWSSTPDLGATWTSNTVYDFGTMLPGDFAYLPRIPGNETYFNLGQITFWTQEFGTYGNDGTFHVVFNGAGFQVVAPGDTINIFPIVYWNSQDQQLIELTADSVARNPAISDTVVDVSVYASIGNAWPHIAVGPDNVVAVVWQQMEMIDASTLRIELGTVGGTPITPFVMTDIYCAVSADNGQTWSEPFKVGGEEGESDIYAMLARDIEKDANDNYFIHLTYLWDTNPGISLNDGTEFSECAWIYNLVDITPHIPVGISPTSKNLVTDFKLAQNYPNPFNPSTTIKFNIPRTTEVTLEVFNNLGQRVSTLVNGRMTAGDHEVVFEGSDLSSGIYFYRLTVDNVSQKRKMVLMK